MHKIINKTKYNIKHIKLISNKIPNNIKQIINKLINI